LTRPYVANAPPAMTTTAPNTTPVSNDLFTITSKILITGLFD
jgi:hypothetical protein